MSQHVNRKWRPPLALVVGGTLAGILATPLVAIAYFRVAGNVLGWAEASWLIMWLAVLSTAVLGLLLWRLVLRPVYALTAHARAVKAGQMDQEPPAQFGTPEFSDLGQSVIDMGETLHNRAASLRAYADHVTHELKSPLTAIAGAAELMQDAVDEEDRNSLIATVKDAAGRMEKLLSDLRRHAAAGVERQEGRAHLSECLPAVKGITIQSRVTGIVPMLADDLRAVLTQLAQNAQWHGAHTVRIDWNDNVLSVHDDGPGIPEGNKERLFDPFFTTTREHGGTGMGLSIVKALVAAHGGKVALADAPNGARFEVTF